MSLVVYPVSGPVGQSDLMFDSDGSLALLVVSFKNFLFLVNVFQLI
jgi:hypothetical protein